MPFTFSHPAIIIPFNEKYPKFFNFTALVLGSMAPDFEYFLRFKPKGTIGHTFLGFIYFDLPMVFIIAFLWHNIVKQPFILSMPKVIGKYIYCYIEKKFNITSIKEFMMFIFSSVVGMLSHVLWDSFTHNTGKCVTKISMLSTKVQILGFNVSVYKILQHGSTLIGFFTICIYIYLKKNNAMLHRMYLSREYKLLYWMYILIIATLIQAYRMIFTLNCFSIKYYGIYIVSFMSALIIATIIISIYFKLFKIKYII